MSLQSLYSLSSHFLLPFLYLLNLPSISFHLYTTDSAFYSLKFSMLGTVTFPAGATIKFSPANFRSDRNNMSFASGRASTIRAAVAETAPALESRKRLDLYEVLKVKRNASQMEIKMAYRTLAKIYHPDVAAAAAKHPEESLDGRDFIEIHNAYATLSDPSSRTVYDLTLRMGSQQRRPLSSNYSTAGGFRRRDGFYTSRRWETDQCW